MSGICKLSVFVVSILFTIPTTLKGQPAKEGRGYRIERYLSVIYPLNTIEVTSPFGVRKDLVTGESSCHSGLDLRADNEPVIAMFDGSVERIGSDNRSGNFVILRHGEYTICYCHLSKVLIVQGDTIHVGEAVAVSGSTGRVTGPYLHVTVRRKSEIVNSYDLLLFIRFTREECVKALMPVTNIPKDKEEFSCTALQVFGTALTEKGDAAALVVNLQLQLALVVPS